DRRRGPPRRPRSPRRSARTSPADHPPRRRTGRRPPRPRTQVRSPPAPCTSGTPRPRTPSPARMRRPRGVASLVLGVPSAAEELTEGRARDARRTRRCAHVAAVAHEPFLRLLLRQRQAAGLPTAQRALDRAPVDPPAAARDIRRAGQDVAELAD